MRDNKCVLFVNVFALRLVISFSDKWLSAVPQSGSSRGGWSLNIKGSFNVSRQYKCVFQQLEYSGSNPLNIESAFANPVNYNTLQITVPQINFAGYASISILDSSAALMTGPGGTAQQILFLAIWAVAQASNSKCEGNPCDCAPATGGSRLTITGNGFDVSSSDYVCKFWCMNSECVSDIFVQSVVPDLPTESGGIQSLVCITPAWPYNAHALAGRTRLTVEKGGVMLPYDAQACSGVFDYLDGWSSADRSQGYATEGSTVLTIRGYGFEVGSQNYSCVFSNGGLTQGGGAVVVDSTIIACYVPTWPYAAQRTDISIYKQICARSIGVNEPCYKTYEVPLDGARAIPSFNFISAVASLNPTLLSTNHRSATVIGGGFDPVKNMYTVQLNDGFSVLNISVAKVNVSGSKLSFPLPLWGSSTNALINVTIFEQGNKLPVSPMGQLSLIFESFWTGFNTTTGLPQGSSAGGEFITIFGQGFLVNATVGKSNDYSCRFRDPNGNTLQSQEVFPLDSTKIVCLTPVWGRSFVATRTIVSLLKGSYEFSAPSPTPFYSFTAEWHDWSTTQGSLGGGTVLTVFGHGFNTSSKYRCRFTFNQGEYVALSDFYAPSSQTSVTCLTPPWNHAASSKTKLEILEGDLLVPQLRTAANNFADAIFSFSAWFKYSASVLYISQFQEAQFSFYPDTNPSGDVSVVIISSNYSIATVSSPFQLTAERGMAGNTQFASVRCSGTGQIFLSVFSNGSNFGMNMDKALSITCLASFVLNMPSIAARMGIMKEIQVRPGIVLADQVVATVESNNGILASVSPSTLTFQNATAVSDNWKVVLITCIGIGSTQVRIQVRSYGNEILMTNVSKIIAVNCLPGFDIKPKTFSLQPGSFATFNVSLDTPPTLSTQVYIQNDDPNIVQLSGGKDYLVFSFNSTREQTVTVIHKSPGNARLRLKALSKNLLLQFSSSCPSPNDVKGNCCVDRFQAAGCNFTGYANGNSPEWTAAMRALSGVCQIPDCSVFTACFRARCCTSSLARQCIASVVMSGCNKALLAASLFQRLDYAEVDSTEKGFLTEESSLGNDCIPYLGCAWQECFPENGNYDQIVSEDILITALPGFVLDPPRQNLQQGEKLTLQITPTQNLQNALSITLAIKPKLVVNQDSGDIVLISPSTLTFLGLESQNFTVSWNSPGRGDLIVTASGFLEYSEAVQVFENAVSACPGFKIILDATAKPTRFLQKIPLSNSGNNTVFLFPDVVPIHGLRASIYAGSTLLSVSPSKFLFPYSPLEDPAISAQQMTISGISDTSIYIDVEPSNQSLHVLSSGVGISRGQLRVDGYMGQGFMATYDVTIVNWGFYCSSNMTPLTGENYSWSGKNNFTGPKNISAGSVDICYTAAYPIYKKTSDGSQCIFGHQGMSVPRCIPKITFDVVNGKISTLRFESGNCSATGLTCRISLNNYNGKGFSGYFSTGISNISVSSYGSGYSCNWACFVSVIPHMDSGQICSPNSSNCSYAPAVIVLGNIGDIRANVEIQEVARAVVSPAIVTLQARQTISITITPLVVPTGNITFSVSSNSSRILTTNFFFIENRPIYENVKVFNVSDLGGGPATVQVSILGSGKGNYDGFRTTVTVFVKPGFWISEPVVNLQQYPGVSYVTVTPDTPPTTDTLVNIITETYADSSPYDVGSVKSILQVNQSFRMPKGLLDPQRLVLVHNGADGSVMKNRVAGSANIFFSVSDAKSNFNEVGRNDAAKISVRVCPGFKSNVPDDHSVLIQSDTAFNLQLTLDHTPTADTNFSIVVSDTTLVSVQSSFLAKEGYPGPYNIPVLHAGISGICYLHIRATSIAGNYAHLSLEKYIMLNMRPGFVTSVKAISLQKQSKYASFLLGLDSRPSADTVVSVVSSNPFIVTVSPVIKFYSAEWMSADSSMKSVTIMWGSPGTVTVSFTANNPNSTYDQVASGNITVVAYQGLYVSASNVLVQKGGTVDVSISTPLKPKLDTMFSYISTPPGIVAVSSSHTVPHNTNDSFILTISHMQKGSAAVRILASASGDIYDGVSYDILVTAMPGFEFSSSSIQLFSCTYNSSCDTNISFWLDTEPTADVIVHISSSDPKIVSVFPNKTMFSSANGTAKKVTLNIKYVSAGSVCLSFAATSAGNYDKVSCGGVTITAQPDLILSQPVMNMPLGAYSHGISDFDMYKPVIYVVTGSYSTFSVSPTVPPSDNVLVKIVNDSPDVVKVTNNVTFHSEGLDGDLALSTQGQTIEVLYLKNGTAVLKFEVYGGNYDGATGPKIVVKAVPFLNASVERANIPYNAVLNLTITAATEVLGEFNVSLVFDSSGILPGGIGGGPGLGVALPPYFMWKRGQKSFQISIQHISAGWTRLRIIALGNTSNFHHSETIVILTLLFPGWDLSSNIVHVQRWKDDTLYAANPSLRGYGLLYVWPQAYPDAVTRVQVLNENPNAVLIQSQQFIEYPLTNKDPLINIYPFDSSIKSYFNISHLGIVAKSVMSFNTPISPKWPTSSGCPDSADTCNSSSKYAIYYSGNYLQVISPVTVYTHAGFITPSSQVTIQRQGSQTFSVALDYPPDADSTISFPSSNASIATVIGTVTFFMGETAPRNVTVKNVNPGIAYISFLGSSSGIAYGGAIAVNAIKIECLKGFEISSLRVLLQAYPTNGGLATLFIKPDDIPSEAILVLMNSSRTDYVEVITPVINFQAGNASSRPIIVQHKKSGSAAFPVKLTFTLITGPSSNYFGVVLPSVEIVPLGSFVFSQTQVSVQKGRTVYITIAPNVPPDQDVTVYLSVSNETVVTCTKSVVFLSQSTDAKNISISHKSKGSTSLSVIAYSIQGNYNGSFLNDGVNITSLQGFTAFYLIQGVSGVSPSSQIGISEQLVVQKQPTSPLSFADFLVTTDELVDKDITVQIFSTDNLIASPVTQIISFQAAVKGFQQVTTRHGGTSGTAVIYFRVLDGSGSNYAGIESGNITIFASPGLIISDSLVDVQKNGFATFSVRPDTNLTGDVVISMISSDTNIAQVQSSITFHQIYQLGQENTITVTIAYRNPGSASISFFAAGANYDGTVWYNGVIGTCRPGFILSSENLTISYAGSSTFTLKPDTVPTADFFVTVVSSQPTKVMAQPSKLFFSAGMIQEISVVLQSQCSTDPGNCVRSGPTLVFFLANSKGGNYDGVNSSNYVLATVLPPTLVLSQTSLHIQQSAGFDIFSIVPAVKPNLETILNIVALDPAICGVDSKIILKASSSSTIPVNVNVSFLSIGQTYIRITPSGPPDSIFADIDPVFVFVRCMGGFNLSSHEVILQNNKDFLISVFPTLEISSDVVVSLQISDPSVILLEPLELIFSPPRSLIGMTVQPRVGMQVVRSEAYQVWPRLGVGVIAQILNDNLDLVAVNWTSGIDLQPNAVGAGGKFTLALYSYTVQKIKVSWVANGYAEVSLSSVSGDVNYNGAFYASAVRVQAQPTVILEPRILNIQMGGNTTFLLRPSIAPSMDLDILISPFGGVSNESQLTLDVAAIFPRSIHLLRVFEARKENWKVVSVSCLQTGSTYLNFRGAGGNYYLMDCNLVSVTCLPGFKISRSVTKVLSSKNATDSVSVSLVSVPTSQVTVVLESSDPELVIFTRRIIFEPLLSHQDALVLLEHAGAFRSGTVYLSIRAFGGNYEGSELKQAVTIHVKGPSLDISTNFVEVQPGGTSSFFVRLDTAPSAFVWINATSSDETIAIVTGSGILFTDTNYQPFNISFVSSGFVNITLHVFSSFGSTYGNFTTSSERNMAVLVECKGAGFDFSERNVILKSRSSYLLLFGPNTGADSTIVSQVTISPPGVVTVQPQIFYFDQGSVGLLANLTLTWMSPGLATLSVATKGGMYQNMSYSSAVTIKALPDPPEVPLALVITAIYPRALQVKWNSSQTSSSIVKGYTVQISFVANFTSIVFSDDVLSDPETAGGLIRTPSLNSSGCAFVRVLAYNEAGHSKIGPHTGSCVVLIDELPTIQHVGLTTLGEEWLAVQWKADVPANLFSDILSYQVQTFSSNGSLLANMNLPKTQTELLYPVQLGTPIQVAVRLFNPNLGNGPSSAVCVHLSNSKSLYLIPLNFIVSPLSVQATAGSSSLIVLKPTSPPAVDAWVRINVLDDFVASVTDHVYFTGGSMAQQNIIISHLRKGSTNATFTAIGGLYSGLNVTVLITTLPSQL